MDLRILSDEEVVARLLEGQQGALEELYDRYGRVVYSLALHLTSHPPTAEEITQDVFLRAWEKRATFDPARGRVFTWLVSIAHHRAIDELRRSGRRAQLTATPPELSSLPDTSLGNPDEGIERISEQRRVRDALDSLPPEQREVLVLAYFHGLTQRQVAQHLQKPLGTVKTRTRLAFQKLHGLLTQEDKSYDL